MGINKMILLKLMVKGFIISLPQKVCRLFLIVINQFFSKSGLLNLVLIFLLCVIYYIVSPSFEVKYTNLYFNFYDLKNELELREPLFHFTNEGDETIIDMHLRVEGKGKLYLTVPKWLKREDNYFLNIPQEDLLYSDQGNTREYTIPVDENVYNGVIKQRFKALIFSENCSSNKFYFAVSGIKNDINIWFNGMNNVSTFNFLPQPNKSHGTDYFSYTLRNSDYYDDSVSIEFDAVNEKNKSRNGKLLFLSGILIGVICSLIANQIQQLILKD